MKSKEELKNEIESFIDNIYDNSANPEEIRKHYRSGYCYFFALMLKDTFGGDIIYAAPYSHIVWKLPNYDVYYDIEGEYVSDATLIPVSYLGHHIQGFKHNPNYSSSITKEEIDDIISKYKAK